MKILILRGGALGDFILTLPAISLLRRRWPQARIELIGNSSAAELALMDKSLDAVYSQHEARWARLYSKEPLPAELAKWFGSFDIIINFWPDPDHEIAARFPLRPDQDFITAAAKPACEPAARHFCEALGPLGLHARDFRSRLRLSKFPSRQVISDARPLLSLHPGSGSRNRNWPLNRWKELCLRLRDRGAEILIVGGEADAKALAALSPFGNCLANAPLPELARRLRLSHLHLGHDTGVTHLAAAVGTPCIVLFGPSNPEMWAPQGNQVSVVKRGEDMEDIPVNLVWQEILSTNASQSFLPSQTNRQGLADQTGPA
jgi:heptosyltransferase III